MPLANHICQECLPLKEILFRGIVSRQGCQFHYQKIIINQALMMMASHPCMRLTPFNKSCMRPMHACALHQ